MSEPPTTIMPKALRRPTGAIVVLVLVLAGCGGVPAPQDVESCEGLVEVGVDWVKRTASALAGQPLEVVTGSEAPPEELEELQAIGIALDDRAAELGCDMGRLKSAIAAGTADIETEDPVVGLFLDVVRLEEPQG